jgi:hypothetical protein
VCKHFVNMYVNMCVYMSFPLGREGGREGGSKKIIGSDLPQILSLRSGDQTKIKKLEMKTTSNGRQPPMEDNLKILKVEYLSNH